MLCLSKLLTISALARSYLFHNLKHLSKLSHSPACTHHSGFLITENGLMYFPCVTVPTVIIRFGFNYDFPIAKIYSGK